MAGSEFPERRPPSPISGWLVGVLLVLVGVLLYQMFQGDRRMVDAGDPRTVTPRGPLSEAEQTTIEIYEAASRSVVHIMTRQVALSRFQLFEIPKGTGSGIVWDELGHIVTNLHVLADANAARVTLPDGTVWDASLIDTAPELDLAVLKINAPPKVLVPIPLGTSDDLRVGQHVLAIGNPFGLEQTLTTGVISGLGRQIPLSPQSEPDAPSIMLRDVIQTDAAINPGNSGGPLLDTAGRLIGVNTMIFTTTGSFAGVGMSIPVDSVRPAVARILSGAPREETPALGVSIFPDQAVDELLQSGVLPQRGVLIRDMLQAGAAEQAGLRGTYRAANGRIVWGDLITAIDDKPIRRRSELFEVLEQYRVGDAVEVQFVRENTPRKATVTLQALPILRR